MYAVIRRYTGAMPLIQAMDTRRGEVEDVIRRSPGFVGYHAIRAGDRLTTITVCDDRAGTEESTRLAAQWVRDILAGVQIGVPEVFEGEVFIDFTATSSTPSLGSPLDAARARA
jgi:hypothetical protein